VPCGEDFDEQVLQEWARTRLAPYQVPAHIVFVDALPRNPMMKIARSELRTVALAALAGGRA
jgi:long-chain acyl-CoA synthetase